MATNARDVKLNIAVGTTGTEDVQQLAGDLEGVAAAGKAAAPGVEKLAAELAALEAKTKELRATEAAARAEVVQQKTARDEQRDALARLRAESDKAVKATDEYKAAEKALRLAIIDSRAAIRDKQAALDQASTSARVSAATEKNLADQIKATQAAYQQQGQQATKSAAQQAAAHKSMADSLKSVGDQLRTVQTLAGAAIGGNMLGGLAGDVAKTADAYSNLAARIQLVTGAGASFDTAFAGVFDVATRTNTAVEQTGMLFTRLAEAGKQIGLSNAGALQLTESINQAVQLSGASADSSGAAITQLIQGLQSGVLRGEEFNSVMEQSPRLAKALADGLGVTTGELRKMAEAGTLTSQTVIASLQGQSAALQKEFESLPPTIGRALQSLSNSWLQYVGEVDKANGISTKAAGIITSLANNLETLGSLLYSAGKAAAAYQAVNLASTFLGISTAARAATVEITALNAAQTASGASSATAAAGAGRLSTLLGGIKVFALVAVLANLKEIGTAIGEGVAKWAGYGKAMEQAEAAAKAEEAATRANAAAKAELAQKTQMATDKALGLNDISRKVVADFEDITKKGSSAADALEKVSKSLELKDLSGITNAGAALDTLALKGKISAADVQNAFASALKGIDLATFATNARAAFDGSEQGARRLKAALDAVAIESLTRAGTSVKELQTGFTVAMVSAVNDVDTLAATLDGLGVKGDTAGRVLSVSLNKALELATTETAVKAVIARMEELGKRGLLTGEQLVAGLEKAREKLDQITPGVNTLAEAMKNLGIISDKSLTDTAKTAKQSYDLMVSTGTSSARELAEAFRKSADAAIAANNGIAPTWVLAQAAARGYEIQVDSAGKSTVKMADDGRRAVGELGRQFALTTEQVKAQAAAMDELNAKYGKPDGGSTVSTSSGDRSKFLAGQGAQDLSLQFSLLDKIQKNTLSPSDLADAKAVVASLKVNNQTNQSLDKFGGAFSVAGAQDRSKWQTVQAQLQNFITAQESAARSTGVANPTQSQNTAPAASGQTKYTAERPKKDDEQAVANKTQTLNIVIGGKKTSVNVVSAEDAYALTAMLRQLESASGVAT